jgi:glycosyltransferase involved in cell wall biosynthesis
MSSNVAHKRGIVLRHPLWSRALRQVVHQPEYLPGLARRWQRWEADAADAVDRVVVCSELDQRRLGRPAAVVPNSYPVPPDPAGRGPRSAGLDIAMVGMWGYQPNFDAARWFVRRILPEVQAAVPGATFHMVGPTVPPVVAELGGRPDVVLHGLVDDPGEQLRRASVVVSPTRFGGGTRVKILEAFAHRLPVVATSMGAEGLDVRDGEHLLVRDDARSFARAVLDLHGDEALRSRLVASAAAVHAERYTPCHSAAVIRREVAALTGLRSDRDRAAPA